METNNPQQGLRPLYICGIAIAFFSGLALLNKLLDLPHLLLKIPAGSLSWSALTLQLAGVALGGLFLFYLLSLADNEYLRLRQKLEKMENSRALLSVILNDSPAAIFFTQNDKVIWVNRAAEDILGWPMEKWLSEPTLSFIYPSEEEYRRVTQELIYSAIGHKERLSFEYEYCHQDGHRLPVLVILRAVDKENLEKGLIFSMIDNSDTRLAGETVKKLNEELEKKVRERTAQLQEKLSELERFRQATIDREFRMKELQDEIASLQQRLGAK
ncbi:MAG: PAS domain S-box protein [Candidatus Omnitrophota bacterium]